MVFRKKGKIKRGTHGHGHSKKWRGAGNRGGRGRAGIGKKAQHLKFQQLKEGTKKGFISLKKLSYKGRVINIGEIDARFDEFLEKGVITKKEADYIFDATAAGYTKVLGSGKLTRKIKIKATHYSKQLADVVVK